MDVIHWEESHSDGIHGLIVNPDGVEGFLLKIGGATGWFKLGEGQDPIELMRAVKAIHEMSTTPVKRRIELVPGYLDFLGEEARKLGKPKEDITG